MTEFTRRWSTMTNVTPPDATLASALESGFALANSP
jgi:hypothetical protein